MLGLKRVPIKYIHQADDLFLQFADGEEDAVTQSKENPALNDLHANFGARLILWLAWPGWRNRRSVVAQCVAKGWIDDDALFVTTKDPGLEVVAHDPPGCAAQRVEAVDVTLNPIRSALARDSLYVRKVGEAQHCNEDLCAARRAASRVADLDGLAREVDEQFLAWRMRASHHNVL